MRRLPGLRWWLPITAAVGLSLPASLPAAAGPCGPPVTNPVACENTFPGNPQTEWDVLGAGDPSIQGFTTDVSANLGDTVHFKVSTDAAAYRLDIYRLGYYSGNGANFVATVTPSARLPQNQPACLTDATTGLIDCGNWAESASWLVPATAVSGIYIAHLVRADNGADSQIKFTVRNDASHSDILYQTSDTTWAAYNSYGGNSLYVGSPANRAYKVSYNRPNILRGDPAYHRTDFFSDEYPMVRWLEANGYDVTYTTGVDTDRRGSLIKQHKIFLSSGHDEYWSGNQRANVEAAGAAGINLAFFSGNEVYWKTRWENSIDGSNTAYRTLVSYKETEAGAVIDPRDPPIWTGTWRDPTFSPPADGGRPENALTGTAFTVNCCIAVPITVPAGDGRMRFWRNTSVATLGSGQVATLADGTLGYEVDEDLDNGARPAGNFWLSTTPMQVGAKLVDYGRTYAPGNATHHMTLHRLSSGALVFGAGTVRWSYGLDATHDDTASIPDARMQQATVNLLADLGAQPATTQPGLVPATRSTDTIAPTSTITAPTAGASIPNGTTVTISGTAVDSGGGVVGGVEISTDSGATWHPALGRERWTYTWAANAVGTVTLRSRAVDDSGNLEIPSPGVTVSVNCPCSIWSSSTTPAVASSGDTASVELGVKFRTDTNASVSGIRFYKGTGNTGTHVGSLWSNTGTLLGTATFSNETASGWQQVNFASQVPVTTGTTYVASYFAPAGNYSFDNGYFTNAGTDSPPLHALRAGVDGPNGVFIYGTNSAFPTSSNSSTNGNYWVDVVLTNLSSDTTPPAIAAASPAAGATGVSVAVAPGATFNKAVQASTISFTLKDSTNTQVAGSVSYNSSNFTATFTPSAALVASTTYIATVSGAKSLSGIAMSAPFTWSFTTAAPDSPPLVSSTTPAAGATNVGVSVAPTATFNVAVQASTISFTLKDPTNTLVAGSVGYNSGNFTATFTPSVALAASTTYTAIVSGAKSLGGTPMSMPYNWSFTTAASTCPCSIWSSSTIPLNASSTDASSLELGVKFRSDVNGFITGVRFYKGPNNSGTHIGNLWSSSGTPLARATFTGETGSGWQQVTFANAVAITAGTTYVASYFAPNGGYAYDHNYFASAGTDNPPLHALANTVSPDGVFIYAATSSFPTVGNSGGSNYWVDVVFTPTAPVDNPPLVSSNTPASGATSAAISTAPTASFNQPVQATTISFTLKDSTNTLVPGSVGYNGGNFTVTFTPSAALATSTTYTASVSGAKSLGGTPMSAPYNWSFTTAAPSACPCSIWSSSTIPANASANDTNSVELGVKFRSDVNGFITGIRFYKGANNTGTHIGNLWSSSGTLLARATFTGETSSGWQQVTFSSRVAITAGTTYVASYFAPNGGYAYDYNYFASAGTDNPPLHALANPVSPDGIFTYAATSSFPTIGNSGGSNYWVDVVFTTS